MTYHRLNGLYREDANGLTRVANTPDRDPLRKTYTIAHPAAVPDRRVLCRAAGDETIRQHIRAGDRYDDLIVIRTLIEKGALKPVE